MARKIFLATTAVVCHVAGMAGGYFYSLAAAGISGEWLSAKP